MLQIAYSWTISSEKCEMFRKMAEIFVPLYQSLHPFASVLPKMHYLDHLYEDMMVFESLQCFSTNKYEHKHQEFKVNILLVFHIHMYNYMLQNKLKISRNRRNLPNTLLIRHQERFAALRHLKLSNQIVANGDMVKCLDPSDSDVTLLVDSRGKSYSFLSVGKNRIYLVPKTTRYFLPKQIYLSQDRNVYLLGDFYQKEDYDPKTLFYKVKKIARQPQEEIVAFNQNAFSPHYAILIEKHDECYINILHEN